MKQIKRIILLAAFAVAAVPCLWPSQAGAWGRGHFYVIGTGPGCPQMATLQALDTIKRMDVIVAAEDRQMKLFAEYIGNKPILFDPWKGVFDYKEKSWVLW